MHTTYPNQPTAQMPSMMNHGGHEMFDAHEILSSFIGVLDQYVMFDQFIQDHELKQILYRQHRFITDLYNITVETFATGSEPSHKTQTYTMTQSNQVIYGMKSMGAPKKPIMSIQEVNGHGISCYMLGLIKSTASLLAMASLEITNPVLRRMMADSVPNFIEMGYELFLYQNKRHYYQVPQLPEQDMMQMQNSYAPASLLV